MNYDQLYSFYVGNLNFEISEDEIKKNLNTIYNDITQGILNNPIVFSKKQLKEKMNIALEDYQEKVNNDQDGSYDSLKENINEIKNFEFNKISSEEEKTRIKINKVAAKLFAKNMAYNIVNTVVANKLFDENDIENGNKSRIYHSIICNLAHNKKEVENNFNTIVLGSKSEKQNFFNTYVEDLINVANEFAYYKTDSEFLEAVIQGDNFEYLRMLGELQNDSLKSLALELGVDYTPEIEQKWEKYKDIAVTVGSLYNKVGVMASPYYKYMDQGDASIIYEAISASDDERLDDLRWSNSYKECKNDPNLEKFNYFKLYSTMIVGSLGTKKYVLKGGDNAINEDLLGVISSSFKFYAKKEFNIGEKDITFTDGTGKELSMEEACKAFAKKEIIALRDKDGNFLTRLKPIKNAIDSFQIEAPTDEMFLLKEDSKEELQSEFKEMLDKVKEVDGFFTRIGSTQEFKDFREEVENLCNMTDLNPQKVAIQLKVIAATAKAYLDKKYNDNKEKTNATYKREDVVEEIMQICNNTYEEYYNPKAIDLMVKEQKLNLDDIENDLENVEMDFREFSEKPSDTVEPLEMNADEVEINLGNKKIDSLDLDAYLDKDQRDVEYQVDDVEDEPKEL